MTYFDVPAGNGHAGRAPEFPKNAIFTRHNTYLYVITNVRTYTGLQPTSFYIILSQFGSSKMVRER